MKRLLPLIFCLGCVGTPEVEAALETNAKSQAVFTNHSNAFEKLMLRAQMEEPVRAAVLELIQQDRAAFQRLNTAMAQFLGAIGELDPAEIERVVDRALQIYQELKGGAPTAAPNAGSDES